MSEHDQLIKTLSLTMGTTWASGINRDAPQVPQV